MAQLMALVDIVTIMMHDVCSAAGCGGWPPRRRSWAPGSAGPRTSGSWSPAPRCGPASSCCSGTSCRSSGTTSSLPPSQRSRRAGAHMTRLSIGMMENVYSRVHKSPHKFMLSSYMKYFAKFLAILLHNTSFFHFYIIFHTS